MNDLKIKKVQKIQYSFATNFGDMVVTFKNGKHTHEGISYERKVVVQGDAGTPMEWHSNTPPSKRAARYYMEFFIETHVHSKAQKP